MMRAAAWCPAHITGFFSIHDEHEDVLRRGSRGAGFNLTHGARAVVALKERSGSDETKIPDSKTIAISINDTATDAPITTAALRFVLDEWGQFAGRHQENDHSASPHESTFIISVSIDEDLPEQQGFGMSAAGSLAAARALCACLEQIAPAVNAHDDIQVGDQNRILHIAAQAAHRAEVLHGGGLGDVAAQLAGGFELRVKEGVPPHGMVQRLPFGAGDPVLLLWLREGISTAGVLRDPVMRERISDTGEKCLEELKNDPTMERFCELSRTFARDTGLLPDSLGEIIDAIKGGKGTTDNRAGRRASMCMLGNSLFAFGLDEHDAQVKVLLEQLKERDDFGGYMWSHVSEKGPEIIQLSEIPS